MTSKRDRPKFRNLEDFMRRTGLTQVDVARLLEITQPHLSLILKGRRRISRKLARRILRIADIPPLTLLGFD